MQKFFHTLLRCNNIGYYATLFFSKKNFKTQLRQCHDYYSVHAKKIIFKHALLNQNYLMN